MRGMLAAERERRSGYRAFRSMGAVAFQATWAAWLADLLVLLDREDEALDLARESELSAEDDITAQVPWRMASEGARSAGRWRGPGNSPKRQCRSPTAPIGSIFRATRTWPLPRFFASRGGKVTRPRLRDTQSTGSRRKETSYPRPERGAC